MAARDGGLAGDAGDADRARRPLHHPGARADRGGRAPARDEWTWQTSTGTALDTGRGLPLAPSRRVGPHDRARRVRRRRCRAPSRSARPPTAPRACWTRSAARPIARRSNGQRLVLCASDGELWGHHKKFADLTLAFATRVEAGRRGHRDHEPGRLPGAPPADLGSAAGRGAGRGGDGLELCARAWSLERRLRLQHGGRRTPAARPGGAAAAGPGPDPRTRRPRHYERRRRAICSPIRGGRATPTATWSTTPSEVRDRALLALGRPALEGGRRAGAHAGAAAAGAAAGDAADVRELRLVLRRHRGAGGIAGHSHGRARAGSAARGRRPAARKRRCSTCSRRREATIARPGRAPTSFAGRSEVG